MPLKKGCGNIGKNILIEEKAGKSYKQALAIALQNDLHTCTTSHVNPKKKK